MVDRRIGKTLNLAVFLCWDMRTAAMCRHHVDYGSCIIAAVGNERPGWRQTVLIDQSIDFGA